MSNLMRFPSLVLVLSFIAMLLASRAGLFFRKQQKSLDEDAYQDFSVVVAATLTLLGLIIGFTFSMAMGRYDQRKTYEEAEANAIGTEYVRADLLPPPEAAKVRVLLKEYLEQRILFYKTRDDRALQQINAHIVQLQSEMWTAVCSPVGAQPPALLALAISGMNDVLNSQGYTQAAWWYRIPVAAWLLMGLVAVCSNLLVGYTTRRVKQEAVRMIILPLVLAIAFSFIADIDSPRRGLISVVPENLIELARSLNGH